MPRRREYARTTLGGLRTYVTARRPVTWDRKAADRKVRIDTPRAALEELALRLRRLQANGVESPIHPNLGDWLLAAIERYLAKEFSTLDAALGLRGRPGPKRKAATPKELDLGRKVLMLRFNGKSWTDVVSELDWPKDESQLRELCDRIHPDVIESLVVDGSFSYPE